MRAKALMVLALASPPALAAQDGSLLDKVRLPVLANDAREAGVPDERVKGTVHDFFHNDVPADDAARFFDDEVRVVREGGSKDNFGAFVRSQVQSGLRGRELSEAIHREHARRGMGKPADAGKSGAAGKRDAKPDDHGKPAEAGKPHEAGNPGEPRKPAGAGKPDDQRGRKP